MNIAADLFQFIETALIFSVALFCSFLYFKTKDALIGNALWYILPTSLCFLISYLYSYFSKIFPIYYAEQSNTAQIGWLAYFFAVFTIIVIAVLIIAVCRHGILLFPVSQERKRIGILVLVVLSSIFVVFSVFFVTMLSAGDLVKSITNAVLVIYPIGSAVPFILAVVMIFYFGMIKLGNQVRLAQYFLTAFLPQIAFTCMDIIFLRYDFFRFTNISYLVFSLLSFYHVSSQYFHSYENNAGISLEKNRLIQSYGFSERETDVLGLLVEGKTNIEIGDSLHISVNTVKSHVKSIYKKCGVTNRVQLLYKIRELA